MLRLEVPIMSHIPHAELLDALRQSLRNLENLKLISPDDLEIIEVRHNLEAQISGMEAQQGRSHHRDETAA
jgi:hypothetical protein